MISRPPARTRFYSIAMASLLAAVAWSPPANAQTSSSNQQVAPVDRIIDSDVRDEEVQTLNDANRVIAAIEAASKNAGLVRKVTDLDRVDIVFMPDSAAVEGGPPPEIATKLTENSDSIDGLRREIESNALLYHAINSRNLLVTDVVGVEFDGAKHMVIFAAAKPPQ